MYDVGDTIVYPMHGAGVIEGIEEKRILGNTKKYYVLKMPVGDMKVMIPMSSVEEIGIRSIIDREKAEEVLKLFVSLEADTSINWNRRYRENMEKIKSGDIAQVAYVVKTLMVRSRIKGLSTGERKMLSNAKQILISELVLAKETKAEEIESILEGIVDEFFA